MSGIVDRRNFLKRAAYGAVAAPVVAGLSGLEWAQTPKPNATHAPATKPAAQAGPAVSLNVKDYGATGDGKTKDTLALQLAIERCSLLGGGEVVFPAGDYATGALALRSGVMLRIEDGASLLGSSDMADYPIVQVRWEGRWIKGYGAFISATDAENIGITGPGKIIASDAIRGRVESHDGHAPAGAARVYELPQCARGELLYRADGDVVDASCLLRKRDV